MKNIVLIGFMGTGKSVLGRRLALRLNRKFIDTDQEIEHITGKTVAQIFARCGIIRFRSEEALLVKKLSRREGLVIATGGGMVLNPDNVRRLQKNGVFIGLVAAPEIIYHRVKNKKNRPLLAKGNLQEQIERLLQERRGAYDVAEYTVDTGIFPPEKAVEMIIQYLAENHYL